MKFELKKNCLAQVVAIALCGTFATSANAFVVISGGGGTTSAAISDAGYFSSLEPSGLGLSYLGREFVNHGTWASNYWLNANGGVVGGGSADQAAGGDTSNPLGALAYGPFGGGAVEVNTTFGAGSGTGWDLVQTVSVTGAGRVAVQVQLTNNSGWDASDVQWGVGLDPDQGIPAGLGFGTTNTIDALGGLSSVTATSLDGWSLTLHNTTTASAFSIVPYIDLTTCCSPVDPDFMLDPINAQAVGSYGFADNSINLAYDIGFVPSGDSVTFGYEYIMAVPEPETYAMLLAGLGLIGFSARRRRVA